MILLLRHFYDPISDVLARLLGEGVRQLRIETWLQGHTIRHGVGAVGAMATFFSKSGSPVLNDEVSVVFNRVRSFPALLPQNTKPEELNYFSSEAAALLWSCLECLDCPVINSPRALGLVGHGVQQVEFLAIAVKSGIIPCDHLFTTRRHLALGLLPFERTLPSVDPVSVGSGLSSQPGDGECRAIWVVAGEILGNLNGMPLSLIEDFVREVGLGFASLLFSGHHDGSWRLSAIDPFPGTAPDAILACLAGKLAMLNMANARFAAAQ